MRERLERRLEELTAEYDTGQARLRDLEASLLRISGAIMVLRELLEGQPGGSETSNGASAAEPEPRRQPAAVQAAGQASAS